jgi:hypothetical protein
MGTANCSGCGKRKACYKCDKCGKVACNSCMGQAGGTHHGCGGKIKPA